MTVTSPVAYPSYWLELASNEHRMNPCHRTKIQRCVEMIGNLIKVAKQASTASELDAVREGCVRLSLDTVFIYGHLWSIVY